MDPDSIHNNDNYPYPDFKIRMVFTNACVKKDCHQNNPENQEYCSDCKTKLGKEIADWEMIRAVVQGRKQKKHDNF